MSGRLIVALLASVAGLPAQQPLVEGFAESKVRVLIYEDLQCPDCAAFRRMMDDKILPRYGTRVAFVHRDFPLAKHAWARRAAPGMRTARSRSTRYAGERGARPGVGAADARRGTAYRSLVSHRRA